MKQFLTRIGENDSFGRLRRKIVVFRSFMARSYGWLNVPGMILILVGVMKPYLQPYIDISIIWLALIIFTGMMILGFLERYLGFFKEDVSYGTEQNRLLLNRLDTLEKKLDEVINGNKQDISNTDTFQNPDSQSSLSTNTMGHVPEEEGERTA